MTGSFPGARRRLVVCLLFAAAVACGSLSARTASADLKLWQEHPDSPDSYRDFWATGYIQPGYIWRQNDDTKYGNPPQDARLNANQDDNFWVQRARIGFHSQLMRYLSIKLEYGARVNALEDAYVDAKFHPAFNVRAGQFQVPFLRTYLFSDSKLAFIDRVVYTPQAQERDALRFLGARDIGFDFNGAVPFMQGPTAPTLSYWAGMYLGQGANQSSNFKNAYMYTARVQLDALGTPDGVDAESDLARNKTPRISVGGGVYSNCDDRKIWNRGLTSDVEFRYQGLYAAGSFVWFVDSASEGIGNALGYGGFCTAGQGYTPQVASGGSLQAGYVLPTLVTGEHQSVEVLARFDQVNPQSPCNANSGQCSLFGGDSSTPGYVPPPSYNDTDNPPSRYRITAGVNYFPNNKQQLRLSLNYMINRETENVVKSGTTFVGVKNDIIWFQMTAGL